MIINDIQLHPVFLKGDFTVNSIPYPYEVKFKHFDEKPFICDSVIGQQDLYYIPPMLIEPSEEIKNIRTVLEACNVMDRHGITKASTINVVGGGTIQDIGGFACAMYRRGIPWVYVPTTLLSQADSCIGGKVALNAQSKNLLGLFSAPRQVIIDTRFLGSLSHNDILCGLGEVLRLCITGGYFYFHGFEENIEIALNGNLNALEQMIRLSLSVKKAVVEYDEFETSIRRAMNLGHSIGHALETLTDYQIPHGIAVAFGILAESHIANALNVYIEPVDYKKMVKMAAMIIPQEYRDLISKTDTTPILHFLGKDKKTEGAILKMAVAPNIGTIKFIDVNLDDCADEIESSITKALWDLCTYC